MRSKMGFPKEFNTEWHFLVQIQLAVVNQDMSNIE